MEVSASVAVERLLDLNWGFVGEREGCNFRERVTREKFTYYCCLLSLISIYKIVWIKSLGGSKCEANQTSGGLLTFSVPKRCHFERDVFRPPSSSSSSSVETKKKKKKPSCLQTTCLLFQSIKPCRFPGTASSSYHLIFTSPIEKHLTIWLNVDQDCFRGGNYKFVWLFLHHPLSGCYLIAYPKFKLHLYKKWPLKIFWWHQIMM